MRLLATWILGVALLAGCSSSEPAAAEPEPLDPLPVLRDAVASLKRKVASAVRSGKLEAGAPMALGEVKVQPGRGARWKRPARPFAEHLREDLEHAGFTITADAELRVDSLVRIRFQRSGEETKTTLRVFVQVFRGRRLITSAEVTRSFHALSPAK